MKNILTTVLVVIILVLSGIVIYDKFFKSPGATEKEKIIKLMELKGAQKLILAEQEVYQEYEKEYGKYDHAKILIRWITKFEYIVDFEKQPVKITKQGDKFSVECPAIELNDPKIDVSKYNQLTLKGSLLMDEQKYINQEHKTLLGRSTDFGKKLMTTDAIQKRCREQMRLFILSLAAELGLQMNNLEILFKKI